MSADLAKMLGKPKAEVAHFIAEMEAKSLYPSHDVRLLSEVNQSVNVKIAALGMDPKDTTGAELYYALQNKFAADTVQIDQALGGEQVSRVARAIQIAKNVVGNAQVWALKPASAKSLLLGQPPKKLMKQLGYRSAASMLKHEDIGGLFVLAPHIESKTWQASLYKSVARLSGSNYELRNVSFIEPKAADWQNVAEPPQLGISDKLTGTVSLWPVKNVANVPLITMILALVQGAEELGAEVNKKSLAAVHPTLQFWANMDHLVSAHPISLNIHDVAHNHLNSAGHENAVTHHGAKALWAQLTDRYQSLAGEAGQALETTSEQLIPAALAEQYQEA